MTTEAFDYTGMTKEEAFRYWSEHAKCWCGRTPADDGAAIDAFVQTQTAIKGDEDEPR
jgi:hypothetical protein